MWITRLRTSAKLAARLKLPLVGLCILAVFMDILLNAVVRSFLEVPLFLDTVFTAAIAFAFGLVPGIFVAVLGYVITCIYYGRFHFFVLCTIAEVLLICALKPATPAIPYFALRERITATYTGLAARLIILYIVCAITVSVLGGIIDYATGWLLGIHLYYFSPEDTFRPALVVADLPLVVENILARIPVNIVDRFIVIFGGYFISRGLLKLTRRE